VLCTRGGFGFFNNMKRIVLAGLIIIAFLLRWYLMPGHLFFGPEQGRDFLVIKDIVVNHKLTLIGSKTDINGIFHGPVYYYLAAIPFAVFRGDPIAVFAFFIAIQSASVLLAYLLAYELTRKPRAAIIAAVLFSVSYLMIVYSRWLSNPPLSIPLSMAFILSFLRFIRGKKWYLVASACLYGLLGQAEFINFLLFGVIGGVTCIFYRKQFIKTKPVIIGIAVCLGFIISFATYVLFDLRHEFLISRSVLGLLQGKSGSQAQLVSSFVSSFRVFLEQGALVVGGSLW